MSDALVTMSAALPTKKILTNDFKTAIDASNTRRDTIVPEELNQALQNLGMRVRKSVTEGYNTGRMTPFTIPVTPNCSPAKPLTAHSTPASVFLTANDALSLVFPVGSPRTPVTPSPKKRTRAEVEFDTGTRRNLDGDIEMDEDGPDSDDDPVQVILGSDANATALTRPRNIKPLKVRREMSNFQSDFADPFAVIPQASSVDAPSLFTTPPVSMQETMAVDLSDTVRETVS